MRPKVKVGFGPIIALCFVGGAVAAQTPSPPSAPRIPVSAFPQPLPFPAANETAVRAHFNRARAIARDDLYVYFNTLCIQDQLYKVRTQGAQQEAIIPAQKVFDQLAYVGQMSVSSWALDTGAGIILFDALNSADEAREIVVPGLIKAGMDPARVKYVVITHAHGDHYGGAGYFREKYGSILAASAADWALMTSVGSPSKAQFDGPPQKAPHDLVLDDGYTLRLGQAAVHFVLTPGHTPGTLSAYFRVTDHGVPHQVGLYGGIGMSKAVATQQQQLESLGHWMQVTRTAGVDAQIGNHPLHFDGPAKFELLRYAPVGRNPFVLGARTFQRYFELQRECIRLELAREGVTAGSMAPSNTTRKNSGG